MAVVHLVLLFALVSYCLLKWLKYRGIPDNFPPGPPAVPIFGVLPFIKGDFKSAIQNWRREYGDVVGLQLGSELAVILSDYQVLSNAFKDSRFTGRPLALQTVMAEFFASTPGEKSGGIVFSHGAQWTEQRRFALKTLRDFGFGKDEMETIILHEVDKVNGLLAAASSSTAASATSLNHALSVGVVNSIWTILTGHKIKHGDQTVRDIVDGTETFIKNESLSGPLMMMPWLLHVPWIRSKFLKSKEAPLKMRRLQDRVVAEHEQKLRESNNNDDKFDDSGSRDFIDVYLEKIAATSDPASSFFADSGKLNLQRSLTDLFGAGSETSSSMLLFAFLYMIKYPEVQRKVYEEIKSALWSSTSEHITLSQRSHMPYTDAVIHEVMRHACLVYAVPHATTEDVELEGYSLPSGTAVYANVWHVMRDDDAYWDGDAHSFRPERFLDVAVNGNDGGVISTTRFRRDERCIPFMLGRRYCIGQGVAQNQLFLFFANILRQFELSAPAGPDSVSTEPIVGFIHRCPSYDVTIATRS